MRTSLIYFLNLLLLRCVLLSIVCFFYTTIAYMQKKSYLCTQNTMQNPLVVRYNNDHNK